MYNISKRRGAPGSWVNLNGILAENITKPEVKQPEVKKPEVKKTEPVKKDTKTAEQNKTVTLRVGQSYKLTKTIDGYVTAADAAKSRNATTKRYPGTYYVYKISNGMYNLSKRKGAPGAWVNLNEAGVVTKAPSTSEPAPVNNTTQEFQGFVNVSRMIYRTRKGKFVGYLDKGKYITGKYSPG
ncbi:hypothetical protein, partial [Rhodovulum adriaticum]|uniref:hypothetical protein n=1 Tax=Rhodovulum adriaticum TaxID=35804 RepID=UPI0019030157